jgi:hypothetical protein
VNDETLQPREPSVDTPGKGMRLVQTLRLASFVAAGLAVLTVLALPGNVHRGMGPFDALAIPLSLL